MAVIGRAHAASCTARRAALRALALFGSAISFAVSVATAGFPLLDARELRRAPHMQAHLGDRHGQENVGRLVVVSSQPVAVEDYVVCASYQLRKSGRKKLRNR